MIDRLRGAPPIALALGGAVLILVVVAIAVAVFRGGGEDTPASVVPEEAPAYFEVSVRPEGEAREGAEAAVSTILDSDDPGAEIISLIEREAAEEGEELNWEEDVAPWLGERIGIFPSSLGTDGGAVVIVETTDSEAALDFARSREEATGEEREYRGTTFELGSDGEALGVVEDFLVLAPSEGFEQAADASEGDSLEDSGGYEEAVDGLPDGRLATLYAVPRNFLEAIPPEEIDPFGRTFLLQALGEAGEEPILGSVTASEDELAVELSAAGADVESEQSSLLADLPAKAWLGAGFADIGGAVRDGLESVDSIGIPGLSAALLREQLRAQSGISLDKEVIGPLGDGAFFLQGTTERSLTGALVIETDDPGGSARLLPKLQKLITQQDSDVVRAGPLASTGDGVGFQLSFPGSDLRKPIQVVQRGDRIVAGYGRAAVDQALSAEDGGLPQHPSFGRAQDELESLGMDLFLSLPPVFRLAESGGAKSDPDYQRAKPYLDGFDFLALGTGAAGDDRGALRLILGLR